MEVSARVPVQQQRPRLPLQWGQGTPPFEGLALRQLLTLGLRLFETNIPNLFVIRHDETPYQSSGEPSFAGIMYRANEYGRVVNGEVVPFHCKTTQEYLRNIFYALIPTAQTVVRYDPQTNTLNTVESFPEEDAEMEFVVWLGKLKDAARQAGELGNRLRDPDVLTAMATREPTPEEAYSVYYLYHVADSPDSPAEAQNICRLMREAAAQALETKCDSSGPRKLWEEACLGVYVRPVFDEKGHMVDAKTHIEEHDNDDFDGDYYDEEVVVAKVRFNKDGSVCDSESESESD